MYKTTGVQNPTKNAVKHLASAAIEPSPWTSEMHHRISGACFKTFIIKHLFYKWISFFLILVTNTHICITIYMQSYVYDYLCSNECFGIYKPSLFSLIAFTTLIITKHMSLNQDLWTLYNSIKLKTWKLRNLSSIL